MSATVLLVRHATPDWARTGLRYDLPPGPPLTDAGEEEARRLGAYLHQQAVRQIRASPLERSWKTALLAGNVAHVPVREDVRISEWRQDETESEVLMRCRTAWEQACTESKGRGPVALVTHGGPIRILLQFIGIAQSCIDFYRRQFDRDNPVPPAGVWRVTQDLAGWSGELAFAPHPYRRFEAEARDKKRR